MYWLTFSLLFALVQLLALASAIHALFTVRTVQGTIAWVVSLVAFPWLALPLYWFFGSRRFEAHSQVIQDKLKEHEARIHAMHAEMAAFEIPRHEVKPTAAAALASIAGLEFVNGNRLDLLIDGEATFAAMLAAIATAKQSVYLQFYIMRNDNLGRRLLEALAAKAAEGVTVCFLVDSLGGVEMTPALMAHWRKRGVRINTFCAFSGWRDRWRLNFRNHRKNVIVDGRIGFIGGHNVGDEYLGQKPRVGPWRDTHVRVEGPAALQLQMVFAADWYFATREILDASWQPCPQGERGAGQQALVLASGPSDQQERCTLFFLQVISMAKQRLWIASPYFVPDEGIIQALQLAAIRGVEVRILLPMRPDKYLVWLASFAMLRELVHPNIHIHRFTGGFLHQKALLVDDNFAAIGTKNFDNRSFRLNFEVTLAVADQAFVAEVTTMFERDFAKSREASGKDYLTLSWYRKIGVHGTRLLAPIL